MRFGFLRSPAVRLIAAAAVVTTLLLSVFVGSASACTCWNDGEGNSYQRADRVFTGLVIAETIDTRNTPESSDDYRNYLVLAFQQYKGNVPILVTVKSHIQGTACGMVLKTWETYLIFGRQDSTDSKVETTSCSGTRLASAGPPITTPAPTTTTPSPPSPSTSAVAASAGSPCAKASVA